MNAKIKERIDALVDTAKLFSKMLFESDMRDDTYRRREYRFEEQVRELRTLIAEEEMKKVQFLVLFKNKYLMSVWTNRESAEQASKAWEAYKSGETKGDAFLSIGDENEVLMLSLSSVDAIKVILSQKDIGIG